jgi:hypothetical protein
MEAKFATEPARELKRADYRQSPAKKDKMGRRLKRKKGEGIAQILGHMAIPSSPCYLFSRRL